MRVGYGDDDNSAAILSVHNAVRKPPQQKSTRAVLVGRPGLGRPLNLREGGL